MRLRVPGRARLTTAGACVAAILLTLAVVGLLTAASPGKGGTAGRAALKPARPFTLSRLGAPGQQVTLGADAGRPVIINFFASWCVPCRRETPLLASFYRAHHERALVIGVDANDKSRAALRFLRAHRVSYPVAFDLSASVTVSYGVIALPQTFFLNARHQIVRHVIGAVTAAELDAWAASLPSRNGAP